MKKVEKNAIEKWAETLTDEQLETEYYKAVYDCLGSQTEEMYERGYDMRDIEDQEELENYVCDKADILEGLCLERGIELWKENEVTEE